MYKKPLSILMVAHGCDGTDVGESWSSFQWASRISDRHCVTLLTQRKRDRKSCREQLPKVKVIEWDDLPILGKFERFNSMLKPGYFSFFMRARRWIRASLNAGQHFDLAHQVSPIAPRYPSPLVGSGIPFIIGPLAGGLRTPGPLAESCGRLPWYTRLRNTDKARMQFDPLLRDTYRNANRIIGVAPYVREMLPDVAEDRFLIASETGVKEIATLPKQIPTDSPIRLLFVGRIVRNKGVREAIKAFKQLKNKERYEFHIVGKGEDLQACRDLAQEAPIIFHGQVSRARVNTLYKKGHVFVFPSYREPSGNVILEALSHGLPCIVCDNGGPGYVVTDACGVRVPSSKPSDYIRNIADAIHKLTASSTHYESTSANALKRAQSWGHWNKKIEWINKVYDDVYHETIPSFNYNVERKQNYAIR
jgi:glycosyltransferase involved in cell wall biosynthesis